jgi:hypothetical protein
LAKKPEAPPHCAVACPSHYHHKLHPSIEWWGRVILRRLSISGVGVSPLTREMRPPVSFGSKASMETTIPQLTEATASLPRYVPQILAVLRRCGIHHIQYGGIILDRRVIFDRPNPRSFQNPSLRSMDLCDDPRGLALSGGFCDPAHARYHQAASFLP